MFGISLADPRDKHAPHFIKLKVGWLSIWYSWEVPIAFRGRSQSGVLDDKNRLNFNQDRHALLAEVEINKGKKLGTGIIPCPVKRYGLQDFSLLFEKELKKEIIYLTSEIMCSELGVKE